MLKNSADVFNAYDATVSELDVNAFNQTLERLRAFIRETERKISLYEQRLTTFRAELEQHFDR